MKKKVKIKIKHVKQKKKKERIVKPQGGKKICTHRSRRRPPTFFYYSTDTIYIMYNIIRIVYIYNSVDEIQYAHACFWFRPHRLHRGHPLSANPTIRVHNRCIKPVCAFVYHVWTYNVWVCLYACGVSTKEVTVTFN